MVFSDFFAVFYFHWVVEGKAVCVKCPSVSFALKNWWLYSLCLKSATHVAAANGGIFTLPWIIKKKIPFSPYLQIMLYLLPFLWEVEGATQLEEMLWFSGPGELSRCGTEGENCSSILLQGVLFQVPVRKVILRMQQTHLPGLAEFMAELTFNGQQSLWSTLQALNLFKSSTLFWDLPGQN